MALDDDDGGECIEERGSARQEKVDYSRRQILGQSVGDGRDCRAGSGEDVGTEALESAGREVEVGTALEYVECS